MVSVDDSFISDEEEGFGECFRLKRHVEMPVVLQNSFQKQITFEVLYVEEMDTSTRILDCVLRVLDLVLL